MTASQLVKDRQVFRPGLLACTCALAVLLGIVFLIVPVHLGYLFTALGVQSSTQIGIAYGINSLGGITGTLLFGWVLATRLKVAFQLALGALVAGLGFVMMKISSDYSMLTVAGFANGLGTGTLLTTLVTWNMRELPVSRRGVGVGAFQSALFMGMFISPILIIALEKHLDASRAYTVGMVGMILVILAGIALACGASKK